MFYQDKTNKYLELVERLSDLFSLSLYDTYKVHLFKLKKQNGQHRFSITGIIECYVAFNSPNRIAVL